MENTGRELSTVYAHKRRDLNFYTKSCNYLSVCDPGQKLYLSRSYNLVILLFKVEKRSFH